jgi:hypothetical protein
MEEGRRERMRERERERERERKRKRADNSILLLTLLAGHHHARLFPPLVPRPCFLIVQGQTYLGKLFNNISFFKNF